jgi:hypothetical protein
VSVSYDDIAFCQIHIFDTLFSVTYCAATAVAWPATADDDAAAGL